MADSALVRAFLRVTRLTQWRKVRRIPLRFPTYHPQGDVLRMFAAPDDGDEPNGTELYVLEAYLAGSSP